jgi:DNA-binding MarR family transcriptional regulator
MIMRIENLLSLPEGKTLEFKENTLSKEKIKPVILSQFDQDIMAFLHQNGPSSTKEISKALGYTERSVCPRLSRLIEYGKVGEIARSHNDPKKTFIIIER